MKNFRPISAVLMLVGSANIYAGDQELETIRKELATLKQQYLSKIAELEQRILDSETNNDVNAEKTQEVAIALSQQSNRSAANTFNPGIGVVLNGRYLRQSPSEYEFSVPGFFLGEEPGPGDRGLTLGESELNMAANVDDKFYASVTLAFGEETEVEEAYLQTTSLPQGLQVKFGRFFSDIGYLNSRHSHSDDFAIRPLAYQAFLGRNFGDDGVQVSWLAPTELFWESGFELYRGDSFPAAGAGNSGIGVTTLFSHVGGDFNTNQSWRAGLSFMQTKVSERGAENAMQDSFSGDSELLLADFIWKWAPNGNPTNTNAKIQGEYFQRREQGQLTNINASLLAVDTDHSGWYVQGVYQFIPQWRVGLRYEALQADQLGAEFDNTVLDNFNHSPKQLSLMVDWTNSEFSRLRLQYSQDKSSTENADLWLLQYVAAFGAHGVHSF